MILEVVNNSTFDWQLFLITIIPMIIMIIGGVILLAIILQKAQNKIEDFNQFQKDINKLANKDKD